METINENQLMILEQIIADLRNGIFTDSQLQEGQLLSVYGDDVVNIFDSATAKFSGYAEAAKARINERDASSNEIDIKQ